MTNDQDQPVSLDTTQGTPEQPVSIDTGNYQPPMAPAVVDDKAHKAHAGLGQLLNKSYDDIHSQIASGNEDGLRGEAASKLDEQNAAKRQQMVQDITNRPGPVNKGDSAEGL